MSNMIRHLFGLTLTDVQRSSSGRGGLHALVDIWGLLRIHNWVKNLTLLLPVFFAGMMFSLSREQAFRLGMTMLGFCFTSSFIYIINDIRDVEFDRLHPRKRNRPIASGRVGIRQALAVSFALLMLAAGCMYFLSWEIRLFMMLYLAMNVLYCFGMKNIAIVDVSSISLGFVLRLLAGGYACEVAITHWIIILVFLLMFSIALAKRRDDLVLTRDAVQNLRKSQKGYNLQFIDIAKSISFSVTLVAYMIYSVSEDVMARFGSRYLYVTSLPVFLGIMRYLQISIVYKQSGSPVNLLLKDWFIKTVIAVWILMFFIILYV
jgi:decaprenyl-phosphate phosphoribosyltransferase